MREKFSSAAPPNGGVRLHPALFIFRRSNLSTDLHDHAVAVAGGEEPVEPVRKGAAVTSQSQAEAYKSISGMINKWVHMDVNGCALNQSPMKNSRLNKPRYS